MAVKIKFACACGKSLAADSSAAGRKAKCPACGQAVQVPQLPPAASESELGLAPIDDSPGDLSPRPLKSVAAASQSIRPPARPSASPVSSAPPPLPGTAGQAVKSIWDEEEEYRMQAPPETPCPNCGAAMASHAVLCMACGYNRQMKTVTTATTLAPTATRKRSSPFAWLSRPRQRRQLGSLRLPIVLAVIGGIVFFLGINEKKLSDASSAEPEQISLAKLIERGPEGNANIILTDYKICPKVVFERKTVGGQMVGEWTKIWVPIVRPTLFGFGAQAQEAEGKDIHALIFSTHVANENELVKKLAVPQLRGLVTNRIKSLSSKEKELLREGCPGIDCDRCLIIDEGRTPTSTELITLYLGGGGLLLLAGIGLGGMRLFGG
jgi:ribosomal protein L32